jgi:hypothetical protein
VGIGKGAKRGASAGVLVLAVGLSGCVAAAIQLYYAASAGLAAYSGFTLYKSVQLTSGGSVSIAFPGKDGKAAPAQPLPLVRGVAVWPENEGEVLFAERLSKSGRYDVTPPARVSVILADSKITRNLKELTQAEQTAAFNTVCKVSAAEMVFADRSLGTSSDQNNFSVSRANITSTVELLAFSCAQQTVVWREQMALIVELGGKVPSTGEIMQVAADAWADRVMQAPTI